MLTAIELDRLGKDLSIERIPTENLEAIVELFTIELEQRQRASGSRATLKSRASNTFRFNRKAARDDEVKFI